LGLRRRKAACIKKVAKEFGPMAIPSQHVKLNMANFVLIRREEWG
jgi:hypothetical protein